MRLFLSIIITLFFIISIYLNRSYAFFFNSFKDGELKSPYQTNEMIINGSDIAPKTYLVLGDSLSAGVGSHDYKKTFPFLYAQSISKNSPVKLINNAELGARIEHISVQYKNIEKLNPTLITIQIGINDVFNQTPLNEFENSYEQTLTDLESKSTAHIILMTIPSFKTSPNLLWPHNVLLDYNIQRYNAVIKSLHKKHPTIKLLDLFELINKESLFQEKNYYSSDQFHPSEEGYILWTQLLINANLYF